MCTKRQNVELLLNYPWSSLKALHLRHATPLQQFCPHALRAFDLILPGLERATPPACFLPQSNLDVYLQTFSISKDLLKHVSHFNMILFSFRGAELIGFANLTLLAPLWKFGEIKTFPVRWIDIKTIPSLFKCAGHAQKKQLTHYCNWFGSLQLISFGMDLAFPNPLGSPLRFKPWQHPRISTGFYLRQALTCDGNQCRAAAFNSLWHRLLGRRGQITVIHHRATLHCKQCQINSHVLYKRSPSPGSLLLIALCLLVGES